MANQNIIILPPTTPEPVIGSLILNFNELVDSFGGDQVIVLINNVIAKRQYTDVTGMYMWRLYVGDVVQIQISTQPVTSYRKVWNLVRRDYTTDDIYGDNGIRDTFITSGTSFANPGLINFTVAKDSLAYDFEYLLTVSTDNSPTPTPTATPTVTPTPTPTSTPSGPTPTPTPTATATPTPTPSPTPSDPTCFSLATGFSQSVSVLYKIDINNFLVGTFYGSGTYKGTNIGTYAKLNFNSNLSLDPSFTLDTSGDWLFTSVFKVLGDGSILIGGATTSGYNLRKLNSNGTINTGFTQNLFDSNVNAINQQSDGKIIIGGPFKTINGVNRYGCARLNTDGTVDNTFQYSGITYTGVGTGIISSNIVLADDSIILYGDFQNYKGTAVSTSMVKLNPNGSDNTSFNSVISASFSNMTAYFRNLIVLSSGLILLRGFFYGINNVDNLTRMYNDGFIDPTFNNGGSGEAFDASGDYFMYEDTDGKYLIGCTGAATYNGTTTNQGLFRLNNNGTYDSTFNVGFNGAVGWQILSGFENYNKYLIGGTFSNWNSGTTYNYNVINKSGYTVTPCITPTPTPTPTATATPTPTPTATPGPGTLTPGYYILVNDSPASYPGTGTTWTSIATGTTYNGTLTNGPVWSGGTPGFFTFDGTNDWVDFGFASSGSTTASFTYGGWFKTTTSATQKVLAMRGNDSSGNGWSLYITKENDNKFEAGVVTTTPSIAQTSARSATVMSNNTWYYVVGKWVAGGSINIYINGILETTNATTRTNLRTSGIGWTLMRGNGNFSDGSVSELSVYQSALPDIDILNNFNANKSKYGY